MQSTRLTIVEDQTLYRQMLAMLLSSTPGMQVHSAYPDVTSARRGLDPTQIDVALLDLRLPDGDGLSLGEHLRGENPDLGIVVLSASDSMHSLLEIADENLGGWSYLSKTSSLSAGILVHAIRESAAGRIVLDPAITRSRHRRPAGRLSALSTRQFEVLGMVAQGLTNAAIAQQLSLSRRSVDAHVNAIYAALSVNPDGSRNPRVEAVRIYLDSTAPEASA